MPSDKMLSRKDGGVGWMIFNNPERHNAISLEMWEAALEIMADFRADPSVRVMVVTGAGGKAFASGADISKFKDERQEAEAVAHYQATDAEGLLGAPGMPIPTIAMIRGYCIGGGTAARGVLRPPHLHRERQVRRPGRQARPRLRPEPASSRWSTWSARPSPRRCSSPAASSTPREAEKMGLVNRVVADDELESDDRGDERDDRRQRAADRALRQARGRRGAEGRRRSATSPATERAVAACFAAPTTRKARPPSWRSGSPGSPAT